MQCDTILSPYTPPPTTFQFPTHQTTHPTTRISFPTRLTKPTHISIRTRATVNEFGSTKPASQMSFYELLGIPETGTTLLEIKQAYKQLARKYHPDVSPPDRVKEYTDRFIRVQEAYETLSDPRARDIYDRDLARGLHLAFSARKNIHQYNEETEEKGDWKVRWQSQVSELKRRSMYRDANRDARDARGNMSWGARMRRQRNESS